jgi:hypothetical protein
MVVIVAEEPMYKSRCFEPPFSGTIGLYENSAFLSKVQEETCIYTINKKRQVLDLVVNLTLVTGK